MAKFISKPITVEAIQYEDTLECRNILLGWANKTPRPGDYPLWLTWYCGSTGAMIVDTLQGRRTLSLQDWLIKGEGGDFYPCGATLFGATYDPLPQSSEETP